MLRFTRGMKSIQSAFLNLVELGPGTRQVGPISGCISTHELHASHLQLMMPTTKLIKNYETYQNCLEERAVRTPGKWGNVTLIHRMSYELKFFIDEVLQCLVDKYQITYQNI